MHECILCAFGSHRPRGSAVAERLWSPQDVTDLIDAETRMNNLKCRMMRLHYHMHKHNKIMLHCSYFCLYSAVELVQNQ